MTICAYIYMRLVSSYSFLPPNVKSAKAMRMCGFPPMRFSQLLLSGHTKGEQ